MFDTYQLHAKAMIFYCNIIIWMEMEYSKVSIQFLLVFRQSGDVLFFLYAGRLRGYTATPSESKSREFDFETYFEKLFDPSNFIRSKNNDDPLSNNFYNRLHINSLNSMTLRINSDILKICKSRTCITTASFNRFLNHLPGRNNGRNISGRRALTVVKISHRSRY